MAELGTSQSGCLWQIGNFKVCYASYRLYDDREEPSVLLLYCRQKGRECVFCRLQKYVNIFMVVRDARYAHLCLQRDHKMFISSSFA